MGFILSKIIEFFSKSRNNFKIIILGIQNAGKTTILYQLSLGQLVKTTPTIGSNVEELTYNNVKFQAWDLGGQESTRSVWDVYYMNTDAVVYVIDSSDDEYLEESKSQFHKLIAHPTLKNATILIFANKQDLQGAKDMNKLIQEYEFFKIKEHIWHIQACSALKGEGLVTGIKWLSEQLVYRGKNNFPNNPYLMNEEQNQNNDINQSENKEINISTKDMKDTHENNNNLNNNIIGKINKVEENKVDKEGTESNNIINNIKNNDEVIFNDKKDNNN
jgi:small GTP-binding protein